MFPVNTARSLRQWLLIENTTRRACLLLRSLAPLEKLPSYTRQVDILTRQLRCCSNSIQICIPTTRPSAFLNLQISTMSCLTKFTVFTVLHPLRSCSSINFALDFKRLRKIALKTVASIACSKGALANRALALVGKSTKKFFFSWLGLVSLGYEVLLLS